MSRSRRDITGMSREHTRRRPETHTLWTINFEPILCVKRKMLFPKPLARFRLWLGITALLILAALYFLVQYNDVSID